MQVQSLVTELRSCMLCDKAKNKKHSWNACTQRKGHMRTQWDDHPQAKEVGLRRNQICQYLNLALPASNSVWKQISHEPPGLWYFVMVAWAKSTALHCGLYSPITIKRLYLLSPWTPETHQSTSRNLENPVKTQGTASASASAHFSDFGFFSFWHLAISPVFLQAQLSLCICKCSALSNIWVSL